MTPETTEDRCRFAEYIRARRLFVLGAGFSAAAGIPMTGTLLAAAMKRFQAEAPGRFRRISAYIRTCFRLGDSEPNYSSLSLSEICTFLHYHELREYGGGERWSDAGSGENLALQYFMAKEVRAPHTANQGLFPNFIDDSCQSKLHPGDIVLSFKLGHAARARSRSSWQTICLRDRRRPDSNLQASWLYQLAVVVLRRILAWRGTRQLHQGNDA
jgi:hypothetical protein